MWRLIRPHALCIYPVGQMRKLKYISAVLIGETNTLNLKLIRSHETNGEDSDQNAHVHSMFTVHVINNGSANGCSNWTAQMQRINDLSMFSLYWTEPLRMRAANALATLRIVMQRLV